MQVKNVMLWPDEPRRVDTYVQKGVGATLEAFYKFIGDVLYKTTDQLATEDVNVSTVTK